MHADQVLDLRKSEEQERISILVSTSRLGDYEIGRLRLEIAFGISLILI